MYDGLLGRELGQADAERVEVQARDLLVEVLRAGRRPACRSPSVFVNSSIWAIVWFVNEFDITKRRVAGRVAEVQQAALGEHDDRVAVR